MKVLPNLGGGRGRTGRERMGIISLAIVITLAVPCLGFTEDLMGAYRQAAQASPVLKRAEALLDSDMADKRRALAALLPKVTTNAAVSEDHADITGFGKDFGGSALPAGVFQDVDKTYTGGGYSVTLVQPLVNGQAWSAWKAVENLVQAGRATVSAAGQDLTLQVTEAYFNVLNAQAGLRVAESQKKLLSEILDQARAALNVGSGDIISLQEAKARFDAAESDLINAENQVQITRRELERLTHQPVNELKDVCILSAKGPDPAQVGPWLETAENRQPLLMQARQQLLSAEEQVRVARRARWPNLNMNAGYSYTKGSFLPSTENGLAQVGLTMNFPIYLGGEIGASVAKAKAQAHAARFQLQDLKDQTTLNVESAFISLVNSVARFEAAAQALESAKTSLAATRKGYEVGTRTVIDLMTTTKDYTDVQRTYYQSLYSHIVARARLKWAAGVLSERDVADINTLLVCEGKH